LVLLKDVSQVYGIQKIKQEEKIDSGWMYGVIKENMVYMAVLNGIIMINYEIN